MPSITQEAKDAVLEALKSRAEERSTFVIQKWDEELCEWIMDWLTEAFAVVESFPISDGWIPVSEYKGWDVITYNVEYDPQEHRTNEWIWIHYDNEFWKISNTATHYKPLPNPPTSHK